MNKDILLRAVDILAEEADREKDVPRLRSAGFSDADAELLANVLPEAFAIPVLEDLGVTSVSDKAWVRTQHGRWVKVTLSKSPVFVAALSLAREHRESGALAQDVYRTVAERSSLINAASKALNSGSSMKGSTAAITFNGAMAESLGYRPWYMRLWCRHAG